MMESDLRVIRDRHQDLEDRIDRLATPPPDAGRALLCQTTTITAYPTTAGVFYAVVEAEAAGPETEGAIPTFAAESAGNSFYALNLGAAIPPPGTYIICRNVGGRWAFRYD